MNGYELLGPVEILRQKIEIRELRAKYAKGARKTEELRVLEILKAQLAEKVS